MIDRGIGYWIWLVAIAGSILSLMFYRSSAVHGPDKVGQEIFAIGVPAVVAIIAGFMHDALRTRDWFHTKIALGVAACEMLVYCGMRM